MGIHAAELERDRDDEEPEDDDPAWCDCGEPKRPEDEACERCLFMDGRNLGETRAINALRVLHGFGTAEAIAIAAGVAHRTVLAGLEGLKASGRVLRIETGEERHINQPMFVLSDRPLAAPPLPAPSELCGRRRRAPGDALPAAVVRPGVLRPEELEAARALGAAKPAAE